MEFNIAGWCFLSSLKSGARQALNRGTGTYKKYAVHIQRENYHYISNVKKGISDNKWILVVKGCGPIIKAIE